MATRPVRLFGDTVLTTRAEEIQEVDASIRSLVADMLDTMDAHGGVGLAANQVGVLKRVFVYDCSKQVPGARGHILNPVWEPIGEEKQIGSEGCLSIPDIHADTERFEKVVVRGSDVDGNAVEFEAEGLLARCIQHETDHLDGVLFLKRLAPEQRKAAMRELRSSWWFVDGVRQVEA